MTKIKKLILQDEFGTQIMTTIYYTNIGEGDVVEIDEEAMREEFEEELNRIKAMGESE